MIIDFHTHTFPEAICKKAVETLGVTGHVAYFADGSESALREMMHTSGVRYAINLPVMTKVEQVTRVNNALIQRQEEMFRQGIITFGGLHPDMESSKEEIRRLKESGIKGVKLHPAFQRTHINDIRYKRLIDAASEAGLITLVHCGLDVGFPGENYAPVPELIELIEEVQPEKLVLAHMGGWQTWDEVETYLAGAPVWMDTSFSLGAVCPRTGDVIESGYRHNLSGETFARLARKHGTDRILFGTDYPWSRQMSYIDLVRATPLDAEEKEDILFRNAENLLRLAM